MEGISSNNHGDFHWLGCLHSLRTQSTLKNHTELRQHNHFCGIELPKKGKNIKQYKPAAKSLKMNSVIYADFESIWLPYNTCENETTKKINQQVPCGYSINVNNHNKETKQTYYRAKATATEFCKEVRVISKELLNIEKKPRRLLSVKEQIAYDNAKCYHVSKKYSAQRKIM